MNIRNIPTKIIQIVLCVSVLSSYIFPSTLNAQESSQNSSPVEISASVDKPIVTVGDLIKFTITLQTEKDIHPQEPLPISPKEGLIFVERKTPEIKFEEGRNISNFHYIFRADLVGRFAIPPITIKFLAPDTKTPGSSIEGTISSPETFIEIRSVLSSKEGPPTLQDIKPIIQVERSWIHYWPYALGAIVIAFLIYYLLKKRKGKINLNKAPSPPPLPCHILALQELELLNKKNLVENGEFREYYFELSEIFRKYLGSRYLFPALDRTRQEIFDCLNNSPELSLFLKRQIDSILEKTDRVKFAKETSSVEGSKEVMDLTVQFIKSTIPVAQKSQETPSKPV